MAPGKDDDLGDVYELLGVDEDAGDKDIQGAFRKGSLKCHPDRNPDDPDAADKFDRLSRAKELLLDPQRRSAYDNVRKAKRELEERFAQEDAKRRKFREDLESRETQSDAAKARASEASAAADAKKRYAQMDFAARIRAKEAELASKQAEVAAVAVKARSSAEAARVRVKWREPGAAATRAEQLKKALADFDVHCIATEGDSEAVVQFGSKEDAIRAVLRCRERRQQLGFRASMDKPSKPAAGSGKDEAARVEEAAAQAPGSNPPRAAMPAAPPSGGAPRAAAPGGAKQVNFFDLEAQMLGELAGLAKAQKAGKA